MKSLCLRGVRGPGGGYALFVTCGSEKNRHTSPSRVFLVAYRTLQVKDHSTILIVEFKLLLKEDWVVVKIHILTTITFFKRD